MAVLILGHGFSEPSLAEVGAELDPSAPSDISLEVLGLADKAAEECPHGHDHSDNSAGHSASCHSLPLQIAAHAGLWHFGGRAEPTVPDLEAEVAAAGIGLEPPPPKTTPL